MTTLTVTAAGPSATGAYIVVLKDSVGNVGAVAAEHGRANRAEVGFIYRAALRGYSAVVPNDRLAALRADPRVAYVVKDEPMTADGPVVTAERALAVAPAAVTSQLLPTGIDRIDADMSSARSGDGRGVVDVDVAVLDSGIASGHPDLNVVGGAACGPNKTTVDGAGHGTHVAGIVSARDNDFGVVGVAPGARLWAVKVLSDKGIGAWSTVICGIDWVTAHAATIEVVNMSLGGKGSDDGNCGRTKHDPVHQAICASVAAGVTYVVSAGNGALDAATFVPAAYEEVLTVSALADYDGKPGGLAQPSCFNLGVDDTLASFSNFGSDIDLIAPGSCIYSTWQPATYQTLTGTSMASPHVAGAAALYISNHRGATPAQVRAALISQGSFDWNDSTDPDGVKEPLVSIGGF